MRVMVLAESKAGEKRVALLPDIISKLTKAGLSVSIESGAGIHAGASDESYIEQGATIFSASDQRKELAKYRCALLYIALITCPGMNSSS